MDSTKKTPPAMRLKASLEDSRIVEIKSAKGHQIGHVINGGPGPTLLVAGTSKAHRSVYQRILLDLGVRSLQGKLVLLFLDQLDNGDSQQALEDVAGCLKPIAGTLFLDATSSEETASQQPTELSVAAILRFCEKHGMVSSALPIFRDYAS